MRPINTRALPVVILAVPEVSVAVGPTITPVGISANSPCLITPVREYVKERSSARRSRTQAVTRAPNSGARSEEHTSELQSHLNLVCRLLLEKEKVHNNGRHRD